MSYLVFLAIYDGIVVLIVSDIGAERWQSLCVSVCVRVHVYSSRNSSSSSNSREKVK